MPIIIATFFRSFRRVIDISIMIINVAIDTKTELGSIFPDDARNPESDAAVCANSNPIRDIAGPMMGAGRRNVKALLMFLNL